MIGYIVSFILGAIFGTVGLICFCIVANCFEAHRDRNKPLSKDEWRGVD